MVKSIMSVTFYWYPNCGSCRKAKKWFEEHQVAYNSIHIVEDTPTKTEILKWMENSELPPRRFFNTSGRVYREMNMKDKIDDLSNEEMASYLASDGMLIRRPVVTDGKKITVGFNEEQYERNWLSK